MSELRLYAITSKEVLALMKGNRGKMVAQAGHAYLHAWWDAERESAFINSYKFGQAAAKIALVVDTTAELEALYSKFEAAREEDNDDPFTFGLTKVVDAGRTCFDGPTFTFVGVGPVTSEDFERIAPGLKVLL